MSLATENLDSLSDYNITQAKLTALTKKIDGFDKGTSKPRNGVAKKALKRLMKEGRDILNRRIDKLMVQFRETPTNRTAVNGVTTEAKVTETTTQNDHTEAPAKTEEAVVGSA